jgi:hypothetical protein
LPLPELPAFASGRSLAYWTEPGEYTLTATWQAGVKPPPPGSTDVGDGFGLVPITSNPVTVQVVA